MDGPGGWGEPWSQRIYSYQIWAAEEKFVVHLGKKDPYMAIHCGVYQTESTQILYVSKHESNIWYLVQSNTEACRHLNIQADQIRLMTRYVNNQITSYTRVQSELYVRTGYMNLCTHI